MAAPRGRVFIVGLAALWLLVAALMARSHLADPFDPSRRGTAAYGHNSAGALPWGLGVSLVELLVILLLVRPWTPKGMALRVGLTLALLVPWGLFSLVLTMHAGGIVALHLLWLAAAAALTAVGGAITAARSRAHSSGR